MRHNLYNFSFFGFTRSKPLKLFLDGYRAFSSWVWLIFNTCCGNRVLYAESSKLGKLTAELLNDLQLIVRSYKYLNICKPSLKGNPFGVQKLYTTHWVVYKNPNIFMAITPEWLF